MARWRRRALLAAAGLALVRPRAAPAQDRLAAYASLLPDLPGWEAEAAQTMSLNQGGASYAWATREYQRGDTRFTAVIGVSPAGHAPAAGDQDMEMRSGNSIIRSSLVRGLRVVSTYDGDDKSGVVFVALPQPGGAPAGAGGSFMLQFEGIPLDEATRLAEGFDWPAMQRAIGAK